MGQFIFSSSYFSRTTPHFTKPPPHPCPHTPPKNKNPAFFMVEFYLLFLLFLIWLCSRKWCLGIEKVIHFNDEYTRGLFWMVVFLWIFSFWKPDRCISGFSEKLRLYKQAVILFQEKLFLIFLFYCNYLIVFILWATCRKIQETWLQYNPFIRNSFVPVIISIQCWNFG